MWFLIGLAFLVGACFVLGWWRHGTGWSHERGPHGLFKLVRRSKTRKLSRVEAGIRTTTALEFEIKPETNVDRMAKNLGLSVEAQVGNAAFDRAAYLVSDDPRVAALLKGNSVLLDSLESLVEARGRRGFGFLQLVCRGGFLRVDFSCTDPDTDPEDLLAWSGALLKTAAQELPPPSVASRRPDRFRWRATVLLAIAGGLSINAGVASFRLAIVREPFTVDLVELWVWAGLLGVVLLAFLCAATVAWLGRTSRAHLVLIEVLVLGAFGTPVTAFSELRDLNIEADSSQAQLLPATVVSKESHRRRSRRSSHRVYTITTTDWNGGSATHKRDVSSDTFEWYHVGTPLVFRQHAGYLGVRWVEGFEIGPAPAPAQ